MCPAAAHRQRKGLSMSWIRQLSSSFSIFVGILSLNLDIRRNLHLNMLLILHLISQRHNQAHSMAPQSGAFYGPQTRSRSAVLSSL